MAQGSNTNTLKDEEILRALGLIFFLGTSLFCLYACMEGLMLKYHWTSLPQELEPLIKFLERRKILSMHSPKDMLIVRFIAIVSCYLLALDLSSKRLEYKRKYGVAEDNIWFKLLWCLLVSVVFVFYPFIYHNSAVIYISPLLCFAAYILVLGSMPSVFAALKKEIIRERGNEENQSFMQEDRKVVTPYSINLRTEYVFGKKREGYVNIINPFAGIAVIGQPGSGKTYTWVESIIEQHIRKGFSAVIYDFKYPSLSDYTYSCLKSAPNNKSKFFVINFDDPQKSNRCNPLASIQDMTEASELAQSFLLNLAKNWAAKRGDFFVESAVNLFTSIIWFLKKYEGGRYCTLPHVIELATTRDDQKLLERMEQESDLTSMAGSFLAAKDKGAGEQLAGQLASLQMMAGRIISPSFYWALSGNDFSLSINDPQDPKILCLASNPDRQEVYGTALGIYLSKIFNKINRPHQLPCSVVIDELPTLYVRRLENLLATARSNKVAVTLGFQDVNQLEAAYRKSEAATIFALPRNIICGATSLDTAKRLYQTFGKHLQVMISASKGELTERMDMYDKVPVDKIAMQQAGHFVGAVALEHGYTLKNVFSANIKVEKKVGVQSTPIINPGATPEAVYNNFLAIKAEARSVLE